MFVDFFERDPVRSRTVVQGALRAAAVMVAQVGLLWTINATCSALAVRFRLPLPGSVLGIVLLFGLLSSGRLRIAAIERASTPLLKHLSFFFVPIAAAIMNFGPLLRDDGLAILIVLFVSAGVGMLVTGRVAQSLAESKEEGIDVA